MKAVKNTQFLNNQLFGFWRRGKAAALKRCEGSLFNNVQQLRAAESFNESSGLILGGVKFSSHNN